MPPRSFTPKTPAKRKAEGQPATGVLLQYESDATNLAADRSGSPRSINHLIPPRPAFNSKTLENEDLVFMVIDVVEEACGARFHIWGVTPEGNSVLLRIKDFSQYFYMSSPVRPVPASPGKPPSGFEPGVHDELIPWDNNSGETESLRGILNRSTPPDSKIRSIEPLQRRPIMYFRPDCPQGQTFLKLTLDPGGNARKAGNAVQKVIMGRQLHSQGLAWRDMNMYEHEVSPLQRFLADVPLSAGAWVSIPPASAQHSAAGISGSGSKIGVSTPAKGRKEGNQGNLYSAAAEGYVVVEQEQHASTCELEVQAPWKSITCLTPDATQLADVTWDPLKHLKSSILEPSERVKSAAAAAQRGEVAPFRMMVLDVCTATRDGKERAPVPQQGDPIVAISCAVVSDHTAGAAAAETGEKTVEKVEEEGEGEKDNDVGDDNGDEGGAAIVASSAAAVIGGPTSSHHSFRPGESTSTSKEERCVVFTLSPTAAQTRKEAREFASGATVVLCSSEAELLLTWHAFFLAVDPDIIALFQVGDTLEAISQRFAALRLHGGGLRLSRHVPSRQTPVQIKRVTMYSAAWVKSQSRMSSTSNQETFKAEVEGRVVVDVLRHCLTACNLASFSMADCVQTLLGETIEVLGSHRLAELSGIVSTKQPSNKAPSTSTSMSGITSGGNRSSQRSSGEDPLRLARYSMRRVTAVQSLLDRLAVIPEAIEMARATGLTFGQVMYNAQMVRTWSLLLRASQRDGCIIPSRTETSPLSEHTFIMHPVEAGTTGLHREPVAILDFASLYPSIYRAYNLCYTTLLHPDDAASIPEEHVVTTPTGAKFVHPEVRAGILPSILAALISARATTRQQLKEATDPAHRAVLDSRQKALKVTANALYGFTGAQASPLQCVPLADSCLAYGAVSCRKARDVLHAAAAEGALGPSGDGATVIYGHTDSLFVSLPRAASVREAINAGRRAAAAVTAAFPPPIELKFERVCAPLMLLHVNRYAGRAYEKEEDAEGPGDLIVKGLKSMWRQAAPIVRTTLHGALVRILMENDIRGAVTFAEGEIMRLLSGKVGLHELVMTGGLWRVTGSQVAEQAAAAGEGSGQAGGGDPGNGEEVRGPHASLAVRLSQRDPGRSFVLGERLQYVLTGGHKLQDDAAEDPLTAARAGMQGDLELYWRNKLQRPLTEIFATCLTPQQLQSLVSGPHTMVKVDLASSAAASSSSLGPASPSPAGKRGGRQLGMMAFYRSTAKCLGCKRAMTGLKGPAEEAPGLCGSCSGQEGKRAQVLVSLLHDSGAQEARKCAAYAACRQCHSGTIEEGVLCDNGECLVTFERLGTEGALRTLEVALRRLDIF